jgi:hypothetical protein
VKRLLLLGLFLASPAFAVQDYMAADSGWTISDVGHRPGDDSQRKVVIEKTTPTVHLVYGPNGIGYGGSFRADFPATKGCRGFQSNVLFLFDTAKGDPATEVREQIHAAFVDSAKRCRKRAAGEVELLSGFDEAFAAVHKRVAEKPYIFPSEPVATARPLPQPQSQGQ